MAKKNIIGERVQKLRKLHQYTLDDLGKYCGCKRQRIYQIESGQSCVMDEDKLNKMAYFLGCTPDYLQGLVEKTDELLQINTRIDEQGNSYIEKTVLKLSLVPGDFRSSLLQKVLCLEPERMYRLNSILDLFTAVEDSDLESFELYFKALLLSKPQYRKTVPDTQFYIYNQLRSRIIPNLCTDAYNFIYASETSALIQKCNMEDKHFADYLNQQLGDFQKESKQKFHQKIKNATEGQINESNSVFSLSASDFYEIIENVSHYFNMLLCEKITNDKCFINSLPNTKSMNERQELIQGINKYLMRFMQSYSNDVIAELKNFLNSSKKR